MKHLSALLIFIITCLPLMAQDSTQGKVSYMLTMNLHANLKPDQQQYKDAIPEFVEREIVFLFKGRNGLAKSIEEEADNEEGGVKVQMKIGDQEGATYINMDEKKSLQLINVGGRQYLYAGMPVLPDYVKSKDIVVSRYEQEEESGETKTILGYPCKKMVSKGGDNKIIYWYTTALPIVGGPMGIMNGKGLVLEMESKMMSVKAKSVQLQPMADKDVLPPPGIKTIDEKEYRALKGKAK